MPSCDMRFVIERYPDNTYSIQLVRNIYTNREREIFGLSRDEMIAYMLKWTFKPEVVRQC